MSVRIWLGKTSLEPAVDFLIHCYDVVVEPMPDDGTLRTEAYDITRVRDGVSTPFVPDQPHEYEALNTLVSVARQVVGLDARDAMTSTALRRDEWDRQRGRVQ